MFERFSTTTPIDKGWSADKKYHAEMADGRHFLIRLSDIAEYEQKKAEFEVMQKLAATGIRMSQPVEFGVCDYGVYLLLTWCEGEEAKELLPHLSEQEQYAYGLQAAEILKKMEQVERKAPSRAWQECYRKRVDSYIQRYRECSQRFNGDDVVIGYLQNHADCIGERPTALMHEDFQTDNMVISPDGELCVIDFQMCGMTDPYLAMSAVGVSAEFSRPFAHGQMHGYFGGQIPDDFWPIYNYYMLSEMLYAYTVAMGMDNEREQAITMFDDYVRKIIACESLVPEWWNNLTTR